MSIISLLIGIGLLAFGRRVFWVFVAGAGFVAGLSLANRLLQGPDWVGVTVGLGIGLLAALLAVTLQRFAIGMSGFLVGGFIALQVLPMLNLEAGWSTWLAFIVGGVIGVTLVSIFLDWALIILSSVAGAALLIEALSLRDGIALLVFTILCVIGIGYQARELWKDRRKSN